MAADSDGLTTNFRRAYRHLTCAAPGSVGGLDWRRASHQGFGLPRVGLLDWPDAPNHGYLSRGCVSDRQILAAHSPPRSRTTIALADECLALMGDAPVTLCIINCNGVRHLPAAFDAIRTQSCSFAEVLLIDDASDDDSLDVALKACPQLRIVQLARKGGPAAARNAGIAAATSDLILFQDNDVRLGFDTAARLVNHLRENSQALVVAPRVVYDTDPETVQYDGADCHFLGLMYTRNANRCLRDLDDNPSETSSMVSCCFLFNRSVWDGQLQFDETFGFNLEDHDFGVRARLAGFSLWVQPEAIVRHGSGTPGLSYRPGDTPSSARVFYLTVNRWIIIGKCYSLGTIALLLPALIAFEVIQLAWLTIEGHLAVWLRAVVSLARRGKSLIAERRDIQRQRKIGDAGILRDAPLPLTPHVRQHFIGRRFAPLAERTLRAYWRIVRRWIPD